MKRLLPVIVILALLVVPQAAQAQFYDPGHLIKVEKIYVSAVDEVEGGCLPSPNVLKVEAELILRQSGITVTDQSIRPGYELEISPNGFAEKSICFASLEVQLWRFELLDEATALVLLAEHESILIGPKSGFQNQLRNFVNEAVTGIANEILKIRGHYRL